MIKKLRDYFYCEDGSLSRPHVVQAVIFSVLSPAFIAVLWPGLLFAWLTGLYIGDNYCEESDKEAAMIAAGFIGLVAYVIVLVFLSPGG